MEPNDGATGDARTAPIGSGDASLILMDTSLDASEAFLQTVTSPVQQPVDSKKNDAAVPIRVPAIDPPRKDLSDLDTSLDASEAFLQTVTSPAPPPVRPKNEAAADNAQDQPKVESSAASAGAGPGSATGPTATGQEMARGASSAARDAHGPPAADTPTTPSPHQLTEGLGLGKISQPFSR